MVAWVLQKSACRARIRVALGACGMALALSAGAARSQVVVSPGSPSGLRQLCVDTSGNVTIDAALNTCVGGQTALTSISVGSGASTTTISGTGVTIGSGASLAANGNATVGGTLGVTGATALSTLDTSGAATLNSVGVTTNATVGGTLGVTSGATVGGTLGVTGATTLSTLSTSGAATLNSVGVTTNATVGGTLGVTGLTTTNGIDNGGGGITNAGAVSGVTSLNGDGTGNVSGFVDVTASGTVEGTTLTDGAGTTISSGTVTTTTLNATTGTVTTLNATTGNVTTLNSSTISNTGATSTGSLAIGVGGVTVAAGAPVSMGSNRVQNVATPIAATDAANKAYVDAVSGDVAGLQAEINAQTLRINSAFREIDKTTEGVAVAIALGGLVLPQGKDFAIGANFGYFDSKQAFAAQTALRLNDVLMLNGGVGLGTDTSQIGGRVGVMAAW